MKQQNARTINAMIIFALLSTSLCFDYIPSPITEYSPGKSGNSDTLPVVTYLSNDKYVITWTGVINSTTSNIWISAYDSTGKNLLAATKVNTNTGYNCYSWAAPDTAGGFVVVWNSRDGASMCCNVNDIQATYYNSAFTAGTQFKVNSMVVGNANRDYAYPSVAWNSSTFLVGFNFDSPNSGYYTVMEERITIGLAATTSGVPKKMATTPTTKSEYKIVATYLNNGVWATAWQSNAISTTDMDILCSLTTDSTSVQTVAPTRINTNTAGAQINPSIITLSTNNFVVAWQDDNGTGGQVIMAQLMTQAGATSGSNFKVNTVSTCTSPNVATLGADGFVVTYKCNPTGTANTIYYQLYTTAAVKISTERQVNTISADLNVTPFAVGKAVTNFMVVYSTGSLNYAQHFYKDTNACTNFTVYYGVGNAPKLKIPFSTTDANYWVKPVSLPSTGTLKTSAGQALSTTGLSTDTDVYYYFTTPANDNFSFTTNYVDTTCKVTLKTCYTSCGTCSGSGSSSANNCLTCNTAASYYPVEDDPITCTTTAPTTNYVLDTTTHVWRHCYSACNTCSALPTDPTVNMFCSTCQTNYYAKEDITTSCFTGTVPGYYFVSPLYKKCYSSCQSCTAYPTDPTVNMFCSTCISGYYTKVDNTTSCFTGAVQGYYLNGTVYNKCYANCKTCTAYPTDPTIDMKCITNSCISAYYPKVDNMTSCFTGTVNFYFLDTDNIYKYCYSTCTTCTSLGDINDHKCGTCQTNYYPKSDKTTSCFTGTQSGYVFNVSIYQKCYSTCDTCTTIAGTTSNHQCQTCISGYYPLVDNTSSCFTGPQLNYYFDVNIYRNCYSTCNTCTTAGIPTNHKCTQCITSYYPKADNMTSCFTSPQSQYYFDGTVFQKCYLTCDTCSTTPGNSSNHQCTNCITGYYPKIDNMTSCFTGPQDLYYLSSSVYQKCFSTCQTCNALGDSTNHQCQSCIGGYFPKVDNTTSCFTGSQSKYYLNTNLYRQCYSTCDTCNTIGDINNHQCTNCLSSYFPKEDNMTSCFTGSQSKYYLDTNIYRKCYSTCETCNTTPGTSNNHQCSSCKSTYFPKVDNMSSCFTGPQYNYYFDGAVYQNCYSTCLACTTTPGNATNHQCQICISNYFPKEDNTTNCYTGPQSKYYLDVNTYRKCYSTCETCNTLGDSIVHKCTNCITSYFPKIDNMTSCFTGIQSKYYFDVNMYKNCYSTCETCLTTLGTTVNHQCGLCITGYFPKVDNMTSCFTGALDLYYNDGAVYQKCYTTCQTCQTTVGNDTNNQCKTCIANYYPKVDNMSNCYAEPQTRYYLDVSIFRQCYSTCETCNTIGDSNNHKCSTCQTNYFPKVDNATSCFTGAQSKYYLDSNIYKNCYSTCETCNTIPGIVTNHQCTTCKSTYFPKADNMSSCFTGPQDLYYFDGTIYQKCYATCQTCEITPGTDTNHQCKSCVTNYYPRVDNMSNCYTGTQNYYYLDISIYKQCYSTCETCDTIGDSINHHCNSCMTNYFPKVDNTSSCFTGSQSKYYLDTNIYKQCYSTCATCNTIGDANDHKCTSCNTSYFPKVDNTSSCFTGPQDLYYLDGTIYQKCYSSCQTCETTPGTDANHQCKTCVANYFPKVDNTTSCYTGAQDKYYLDVNLYKQCYSTCATCNTIGDSNDHKCSTCLSNYFPKVDNMTSCFTGAQSKYYLDGSIYQHCYSTCETCNTTPGISSNHQCTSCISTYFPKADNMSSCFAGAQNNYYFDGTIYQNCYTTCLTCETTPGDHVNNQCKTCIANYYPRVDNMANCYTAPQDKYYLDVNVYKQCYTTCETCNTIGDTNDHKCASCITSYYPKVDNLTSCYTGSQSNYYLYNGTYKRCYSTCDACSNDPGTASDHKCTTCLSSYFPKEDNTTSCFTDPQAQYYLDINMFKKCYPSCQTCEITPGTGANHQCKTCIANYYAKEDNPKNCYTGDQSAYYLDAGIYKKCYSTCLTCNIIGNDSNHQCTSCIANYYPETDNSTSCYFNPAKYYLDNNVYKNCYSSCQTCETTPGTDANHQCKTCVSSYYPKVDNTTSCYTGAQSQYYLDVNIYKQCYSTCQTCDTIGDSNDHKCTSCQSNYFPKVDNMTSCFTGNQSKYYLDNNIYKKCYSTCEACTVNPGTVNDHQCTVCITNYFPKVDNMTSCFNGPQDTYYLDSTVYKKCYSTCQTCDTLGDNTDQKCNSCIATYFPKVDMMTNCYNGAQVHYYLDSNLYNKCYATCETCNTIGDVNDHKCNTCHSGGYFPKVDNMTSCFTGAQSKYYLDNNNIYQKCYSTCETCNTTPGDANNHKCTACVTGFYPKADNTSSCFTGPQNLYYFDGSIYQNCYSTCQTCETTPGTGSNHQCKTCIANYFPKVDNLASCYTGPQTKYYLDVSIYKQCFSTCETCNTIGDNTDHKCNTCISNYFPKVDNMTSCFNGAQSEYYLDTNIYQKCYLTCQTCTTTPGTVADHQCTSCKSTYFPKVDNTSSCFTGPQDLYYLDGAIYQKCYSTCLTCETTPGTDTVHQCKTCLANYFPKVDNLANCYTGTQNKYYLDVNIYKQCYSTCGMCNTIGDNNDHKCDTCITNYFPKVNNITSCFTGSQTQYYLDINIYKLCYSTCETCNTIGDINDHKCTSCHSTYFPKADNTSSCFTGAQDYYYLDLNIFQKCYSTCQTCQTTPGTNTNHQCKTCIANYFPRVDNLTNCYTGPQDTYFLDVSIYRQCYSTCSTCNSLGDSIDHKCTSCVSNYFPKIDNTSSCYTGSQSKYYLDTNIYRQCYSSCETCTTTPGTASNHQCNTCKTGYLPKIDNMSSCFTGPQDYYYNDGTIYQKCYSTCQTCETTPGSSNNHQCKTCIPNYFPSVDNTTSCFTGSLSKYYLDTNIYRQCYSTCLTCNTIGDSNDNKCTSCIASYFPKVDVMSNCFTGPQTKYYLDGSVYQKCYSTCDTCTTTPGDATNHQCNTCITNFYPKEDIMSNCYTGQQSNYYLNGSVYLKCYSTCDSCSTAGNSGNHLCTSCIANYFPKVDNMSNCYTGTVAQYYLGTGVYQQCYSSCQTCNMLGNSNDHKCNTCLANYFPKVDNMTSCFTGAQPKYYLDGTTYQKCYSTCETCTTTPGDVNNHQCTSCVASYFPKIDMMSNCFTGPQPQYYLDNNLYQKCYSTCQTCSSTPGTSGNHQCSACITNYFPKSDNLTSCFSGPQDMYYFDTSNNIYKNCYSTCLTCTTTPGDNNNHQCATCMANYFPKIDNTSSCYTGTQSKYYLDTNIYKNCYSTCEACSITPGTSSNHQCTTCLTNYFPLEDNTTSCFTDPQPQYYLDINMYRKCFASCQTCQTTPGTTTNHKCNTCLTGYYPLIDNQSSCYQGHQSGYYLDGTYYQLCYSTCDSCNSTPATASNHQCTVCKSNLFFKADNLTSCFINPQDYYYFDGSMLQNCYSTCKTCETTPGTANNHQCKSCIANYFPKVDNMANCYTGPQSNYYLDGTKYQKCYSTCDSCSSTPGDTNNHQCNSCITNYFPLVDNMNNCYTGAIDHYYLDGSSIYQKCYVTCQTCKDKAIDDDHQQCDTCLGTYYPKEDNLKSCYTGDQSGYFYENNLYKKCHSLCETCTILGTDIDNQCLTCIANYYPKVDDTTNCFTGNQDHYFLLAGLYKKCYQTCLACNGIIGTDDNHQCTKCVADYYPRADNLTSCFTGTPPENYFFDGSMYRNCYLSCETCYNKISTPLDHQCIICANGYQKVSDGNNCVPLGGKVQGYYLNETEKLYKPCYRSCMNCRGEGSKDNNNCTECVAGYYRSVNDLENQCYSKVEGLPFYYFNESKQLFEQCYDSCKTCAKYGTAVEHNCSECKDDYVRLYENSGMCYQRKDEVQGHLYDIKQDIFKPCYKSCYNCIDIGDELSHYCSICKEGYFNTIDNNSLCYRPDEVVRGYFFDKETNLFNKCYKTCSLCYGPGTLRDPNCFECKDAETDCSKCTDYTYNDTCVKTCPNMTVQDTAKQECYDCEDNQIVFKNTCLDNCFEGYIRQSDTCVSCQSLDRYYYNGNCVDSCPDRLVGDSANICRSFNFELKGK
jgi:hypothetical protein